MNKFFGIGNLTKDPELSTSGNNITLCRFTIAIARKFSQNNETDFIDCICFKNMAENVAKYLTKGSKVAVNGSLQINKYTTNRGENRISVSILCDDVEFLNTKKENSPVENTEKKEKFEMKEIDDDDLPF